MIDVRIFGVPKRMGMIERNRDILRLPEDRIVIDEKYIGCIPTARRAWSIETSASHVLVMTDDVELCDGFMDLCELIVSVHPDVIFSLYPGQFPRMKHIKKLPTASPYVRMRLAAGPAIIMPSEYVKPCLKEWDDNATCGDDGNITNWAKKNGIAILTTIPSLVQHIGRESVEVPGRDLGDTDFFNKNPEANWQNSFVYSWANIAKR